MSEIAKHTPGPWEIDDQPHREIRIGVIGDRDVETEHGFVAQAYFSEVATIADTEDGEANARLIAAAPDLLDALQYVLSAHGEQLTDAFEQANKAIAKATGAP